MASERLSQLQRHILVGLMAEAQCTGGTMAASHQAWCGSWATTKATLSRSLKGLEAKGLVRMTRTPGCKASAVGLTAAGRNQVARLTASCD